MHALLTSLAAAWVLAVSAPASAAAADPVLTFERTVIDLGPVSDEQALRQPFRFTYTGARSSKLGFEHCHFCKPPDTDRPRYEPGQTGMVIVELQTMGKHGDTEAVATVFSDTLPGNKIELRLKASVRPAVMVRSEESFEDIPRSKGGEATILIIGRKPDFEVRTVSVDSTDVEAAILPVQDVEDLGDHCRGFPVRVRVKPGLAMGPFTAALHASTSDPLHPTVDSTIQGDIVGDLNAYPDHVSIGELAPATPFAASFTLARRDNQPLWYGSVKLGVDSPRGMPPVVLDAEPGDLLGTLRIHVYGTSPLFATESIETVVVVTSEEPTGKAAETLRIPVRMLVRPYRAPR